FEKSIQTNLSSAYYLSRALIPAMKGSNHAHLFSVCSTASITAYPNGGSYCISKFALLGMTKVLREELKPDGIAVTAILPGATYTHSWSGSELPESRFMQADHIANVVFQAYQLSPQSVIEELLIRPMQGDIT
ncbi:MAG: SDR family oxidoreductase, partial [Bacteroidota bacterium]|nr:SDR family oxidoreductase [Bacteroidota bacterium]